MSTPPPPPPFSPPAPSICYQDASLFLLKLVSPLHLFLTCLISTQSHPTTLLSTQPPSIHPTPSNQPSIHPTPTTLHSPHNPCLHQSPHCFLSPQTTASNNQSKLKPQDSLSEPPVRRESRHPDGRHSESLRHHADSHHIDSGSSSEGFCENETLALEKPLPPSPATSSSHLPLHSSTSSNSLPANPLHSSLPLHSSGRLPLPSLLASYSSHPPPPSLPLPPPTSSSADTKDSPSGGSLGCFGLSPQPRVDPISTTSYDESDSPSGEKSAGISGISGGGVAVRGPPVGGLGCADGPLLQQQKKVSTTPSVDELDSDWSDYPGNGMRPVAQ